MVIPKGCPRCHGDLAYVSDIGDTYYSCVQCGFMQYQAVEHNAPAARAIHAVIAEQPRAVAASRDEVHRRRLRRRLAERYSASSVA